MMKNRQLGGRALVIAVVVALAGILGTADAQAQDVRERAKRLYREGRALYDQGNYRAAVDKFKQADTLVPAAAMDYNIGLAYDKMNDRANALKHYRSYLRRDPGANNRSAVEAKIRRIEGELRAEAERQRAAEAAAKKKAEEEAAAAAAAAAAAQKAEDEAAARKKAEEEAAAAKKPPAEVPPPAETAPPVETDPAAGTAPTPKPAGPPPAAPAEAADDPFAPTGDPEVDRVAQIDVTALREQRGLAGTAPAPRSSAGDAPRGDAAPAPEGPVDGGGDKKKSKPAYKQWWFWVIVGVSAIILIDIATTGDSNNTARMVTPMDQQRAMPGGGAVLWRF
jgi:hypothetical protein